MKNNDTVLYLTDVFGIWLQNYLCKQEVMFTIFQPLRLTFYDHNYKTIFIFFKSFWIVPRLTSLWRLLKYSINWRAECSFKINRGLYILSTIAFSIAHAIMYTEIWIFDILYKVSNCFRPNKKTNRRRRNSMKLFFLERWWECIRNAFWWLIHLFPTQDFEEMSCY